METTDQNQPDELLNQLAQRVDANRADLVSRYRQSLLGTMFTNRTEVHPREIGRIAAQEADALINGFLHPISSTAMEHGIELCQIGLSEQTILALGRTTRRFVLTIFEGGQTPQALDATDTYLNLVILGFIDARDKLILAEQERIRGALQIAISRYTVEIKEVQAMARKATEANEFKSQFIARMSHELRTPLGALLGMTEMLQQTVYGPLSKPQEDIVQRICNNALALRNVFSELLDHSHIESGQMLLKQQLFSPETLAKRVHSNYLSLALQKGLSMHVKADPKLPEMIVGDEGRIEQILSNLVVNAIKFTKTGGVTILLHGEENSHWMLQVKDTGMGISPEDQSYIFEPFRQADESTSRSYGGVGLGLSIVRQLVDAMDGSVKLESKFGQGSVFTVLLPLKKANSI